jgi:hypothetical protein
MVTDRQLRLLFREFGLGASLAKAARRADMDEKTARKYRSLGALPTPRKTPRTYRTRPDPFIDVWPTVQARLDVEPGLQSKTLFDWMKREFPGRFHDRHRRTFERRVRHWRATAGPARPVMFSQLHHAGDLAASDFTSINSLAITIAKRPFDHLMYHFVLTYSNWESVTLCCSESFEALSDGLQNAIWELGGVPQRHRSDSLTAAVNNLSHEREFQSRYKELLDHYGVTGEKINVRQPHENGDSESSHGHFKNALDQALLLRGSRDFNTRDEYCAFVRDLVKQRNEDRGERVREDFAALGPLPEHRLDCCRRVKARVDTGSLIHIHRNVYSVHSRLIGEVIEARLHADRVEIWYAGTQVDTLPRLAGRDKHAVNYRHIIDQLVRKPGAFENYRYREDLFPTSRFRFAYDRLHHERPGKTAMREYLRILQHAARENEAAVDDALRHLLAQPQSLCADAVITLARTKTELPAATDVTVEPPDLRGFDCLLEHMEVCDVEEGFVTEFAIGGAGFDWAGCNAGPSFVAAAFSDRVGSAAEGAVEGFAAADVPRAFRVGGGTGDARATEPSAVPCGACEPRMPGAESEPDSTSVPRVAVGSWQDMGSVRLVESAVAGGGAASKSQGGDLLGPAGEPAGFRQAGFGENPHLGSLGGADDSAGPLGVVYHVQPAGAGVVGGQARIEVDAVHQTPVEIRGFDHRRSGLCSTEPRGDGSVIHASSGAIRAGERSLDKQPAVFAMGTDLQGSDDDGGSDRPISAPQRDHRAERCELSSGDRESGSEVRSGGDARLNGKMIDGNDKPPLGILVVAKAEF